MPFFFNFPPEVQNIICGELDLKSLANLNNVSLGFNCILQPPLNDAKSLADALYNTQQVKTLPQWIDEAGYILICASETHACKLIALSFLIHVFDFPQLIIKPDQRLLRILSERQNYKRYNAEYIPGFSPKHLHLPPEEHQITHPLTGRQKALMINQELLDVANEEKRLDLIFKTPYLTSLNRANYRVLIYQGKFYQGKRLFDTRNYTSHNKTNFAAYTFNANGELSVFNHFGIPGEMVHSSMNSGSPVVCAGELQIRQGELKIINTHSGHYRPSLFNVYRFLNYLVSHGVNIDHSFVDLLDDIRKYQPGIKVIHTKILTKKGLVSFYRISARMLVKKISEDMYTFLDEMTHQVKDLLSSFKLKFFSLKDKCINSQLTKERKALAQSLLASLEGLRKKISEGATIDEIEEFADELKLLKQKNETLSRFYKKDLTNGDLQALLCRLSNSMTIFNEKEDINFFPIQGIVAMKSIH